LTTTVQVNADQSILVPLLGQVSVKGLPIPQISKKLEDLYADGYLINPQANVFIEEYRSRKAIILGHIHKPGLYNLRGATTFLELISKAGGLTEDAGGKAMIKRKKSADGPEEKIITIDLEALIERGDMSLNVSVMDGDSIYINKAGFFFITGEVKKPDSYKWEKDTTVIKAITMAGGLTAKASADDIRIIRKIDQKKKILERNKMDEPVLPDDVIVIPESFF
jgi:polysaccharide export outer membrane protein